MIHNGIIATKTLKNKTVRRDGQSCQMMGVSLLANQGEYPAGLLIAERADGQGVAFKELTKLIGTGNGSTKNYSGIIDDFPLEPGSVVITDGVETFIDDGFGRLHGSAGGTGTLIYSTGEATVSFFVNVVNASEINATAKNKFLCVLDQGVDTATSTAGVGIYHGPVKAKELLKGSTFALPVDSADMKMMREKHIFPG